MSDAEWRARVDLAAVFRLIAHYRMSDLAGGFMSARIPDEPEQFVLGGYGVFCEEQRASELVKLDWKGNVLDGSAHDVNATGVALSAAIFRARPDVNCVVHAHTKAAMVVGALECGLLPISQPAFNLVAQVRYSEYEFDADEAFCNRFLADLGDRRIVLMRNHGLLAAGRSAAESFFLAFYLNQACDVQATALQTGHALHTPPPADIERWSKLFETSDDYEYDGSREWPGLIRLLDRLDPTYAS
jgi:ribulose-5-phosphate 4-epimerase/fuculose-1-phosphate aldolase